MITPQNAFHPRKFICKKSGSVFSEILKLSKRYRYCNGSSIKFLNYGDDPLYPDILAR